MTSAEIYGSVYDGVETAVLEAKFAPVAVASGHLMLRDAMTGQTYVGRRWLVPASDEPGKAWMIVQGGRDWFQKIRVADTPLNRKQVARDGRLDYIPRNL